jgi:membrane-bound lytic murein transglycosylase D
MASSDPPKLKVTVESGTVPAAEFVFENWFRIGRHTNCQIQLVSRDVSRYHADVFIDGGQWWIQDLDSANGIFVEGRKIDKFQISGTTRIRLGRSGPVLTLAFETAATDAPEAPGHQAFDSRTLTDYQQHYFSDAEDGTAIGEHTMMVRKAYAEVKKKQRRMYGSVIAAIAVLCALTGGYAIYKHREVKLQRRLAVDIFYNMKSLEIELAKVIKAAEAQKSEASEARIEAFRDRQQQLEESYNRFVDTLDVYSKGLSREERIILHMARQFGECEVNMPKGFVREVMRYIEKWKSSPRLEQAIQRARSRGYVSNIVRTLQRHGLPPQFFYLALQESNFNPDACGPETRFGIAKGMWQFIPSTAEMYYLQTGPLVDRPVPDPYDERHHFGKSTLAAARYLRDIYTTDAQASGLLVMASYNWGENRVAKLIRSMPKNSRERNFWQLISKYRHKIPDETYNYVFYIFSAAVIGENPRLFGYDFDNPLAADRRMQE